MILWPWRWPWTCHQRRCFSRAGVRRAVVAQPAYRIVGRSTREGIETDAVGRLLGELLGFERVEHLRVPRPADMVAVMTQQRHAQLVEIGDLDAALLRNLE